MKKALMLALAVLFSANGQAAVVAEYLFTAYSLASSDANSATMASDYSTNAIGGSIWNWSGAYPRVVLGTDTDGTSATLTAALAADDYDEFTISVAEGYILYLNSISYDHEGNNASVSKTYVVVDADGNGFTFDDWISGHNTEVTGSGSQSADFNLGSLGAVVGGDSIAFRLYYSDDSSSGDRAALVDNIVVSGTSIVSESAKPVEVVDISPVSGNMIQAVLHLPDADTSYWPEATTNLVEGGWANVPHSHTNDAGTLAVTNLAYSSADATGTNRVIYLEADTDAKFFRIPWDTPWERPFPILAWIGPGRSNLTEHAWGDMARAGFNLCNEHNITDPLQNEVVLALGEKYGVGVILRDPRIYYNGASQPQIDIEAAVLQWMDYPALAGYSVSDEPDASAFAGLARIKGIIAGLDTNHSAYVNLFPNYASSGQLGTATYTNYVDTFMATFAPETLSFDHYPITTGGVNPGFYENLEIIRTAALNAGVPFSAFTLSIPHNSYPTPTEGHLRFQLYSDLAYGAKELQYFTYGKVEYPGYGNGLIDSDGNTTATYNMASNINWEIQHMGPVLLDLESTAVFHSTPNLPSGTTMFTSYGGLTACSGEAVLGFFEDSQSQTWLMAVNRDPYGSESLTLTFDGSVASVWELDRTVPGGVLNEVTLTSQQATISLAAGDGRLFRIDTL